MSISSCFSFFRTTATKPVPTSNLAGVASSAKELRAHLQSVGNTARDNKGFKIERMHDKSLQYTKRLIKSAEQNDIKSVLKHAKSLNKHAPRLFNSISNPFNREPIREARNNLHDIDKYLLKQLKL